MPIDTSIYNNIRAPQFVDPLESMSKAMTLKSMVQKNRADETALQNEAKLGELYKKNTIQNPDGSTTLDQKAVLSDLYKANPRLAMKTETEFTQKNQEKEKYEFDKKVRVVEEGKRLMWSVNDQSSWENMLGQAREIGLPNVEKLPQQYDPALAEKMKMGLLNASEQIAMKQKDLDNKFRDREFNAKRDESKDKNKVELGKLATDLRKERSGLPTTKATQILSASLNKMESAASSESPAADMGLIFGYMKMLDPNSTVREGEYATAKDAGAVDDKVWNTYNNVLKGQKLTPTQRADFMNQARGIYKGQLDIQKQFDSQFSNMAQKSGVDPNDVLLNFEANPSKGAQTKKKGGFGINEANAGELPILNTKEIEWAD